MARAEPGQPARPMVGMFYMLKGRQSASVNRADGTRQGCCVRGCSIDLLGSFATLGSREPRQQNSYRLALFMPANLLWQCAIPRGADTFGGLTSRLVAKASCTYSARIVRIASAHSITAGKVAWCDSIAVSIANRIYGCHVAELSRP
jgi:hypothetical protein